MLIHGNSKVGKSTFAVTAPYPRLYLDVESASRFLPITRKVWDPFTEPIPVFDGSFDTVVVYTRDFDTMLKVYQRINEEDHQFKSLIIDSVSELQVRLREQLVGREALRMQDWGTMLTVLSGLLRDIRDLTMHPRNPLEAIVLTAMTTVDADGMHKPLLQGQTGTQLPYWFDVVGYLYVDQVADSNPQNPPREVRRLLTRKHPQYEAGERVQGRLDNPIDNPNIVEMLDKVFPHTVETQSNNDKQESK
jgi:hypothetical protein